MRLERRTAEARRSPLGAIFGGVLLLAGAGAAVWLRLGLPRPICHFHTLTGVPCPTCGSTRLVEALLRGELLAAFGWNPLVFVGLSLVALWAVASVLVRVTGLPSWRLRLTPRETLFVRLLAIVVILAGWGYVIWIDP
jgi:hypothetical protein